MAGEWLKMELSTPDKPEVLRMARILAIDKDAVLGKLFRVWAWFDKNTVDGHVDGVVSTDVDGIAMNVGFCSAMQQVGWFEFNDDEQWVRLTNFDRHNGETAKNRALKNKRQSKWRANVDAQPSTQPSTETSTREEKRRSKEHMSGNPDHVPEKPKKQTRATEAKEVLAYMNQVCGSRFQPVAANLNLITARLNEGATVDDVKAVIDSKYADWCNDDTMRKFLRPETLFNATKFAGYLGAAGMQVVQPVKTDPAEAQRSKEWAQFEYAVRSFRETVWPDGMEEDRLRRAAEIQQIADSFGVTFERPLLEVAA